MPVAVADVLGVVDDLGVENADVVGHTGAPPSVGSLPASRPREWSLAGRWAVGALRR